MSGDLYSQMMRSLFMFPINKDFHQTKRKFEMRRSNRKSLNSKSNCQETERVCKDIFPKVKKNVSFSLFHREHKKIVAILLKWLLSSSDVEVFLDRCLKAKDYCPPQMFLYCFTTILVHRKDFQFIPIPNSIEIFPYNFLESKNPNSTLERRNFPDMFSSPRNSLESQSFLTYRDEDGLAYFREDIGINNHHWHWYSMYPSQGPPEIVQKERRGELFLYWHHQIVARFNSERLCNGFEPVKALDLSQPIEESYFPKIFAGHNKQNYYPRLPNLYLQDVQRDDVSIQISKIHENYQKILEAIEDGYVVQEQNGARIYLMDEEGTDILGNIIEGSSLSVNPSLYGHIYNDLHLALAYIHDPIKANFQDIGVMGDIATSIRDPVFYRLLQYIDDLYFAYKNSLLSYEDSDLAFSKIEITKGFIGTKEENVNLLKTHWQISSTKLGSTVDLTKENENLIKFQHLQNKPFHYFLQIMNHNQQVKNGTCRIFLAPRKDHKGRLLKMEQQRLLAIEMDKFSIRLLPGLNPFVRTSLKSSITSPYSQTFSKSTDSRSSEPQTLRTCGWPQHMLLPKGGVEGKEYVVFIMISNEIADSTLPKKNCTPRESLKPHPSREFQETFFPENSLSDDKFDTSSSSSSFSFGFDGPHCGPSISYYDLQAKNNPDRRAMGFPLDRVLSYEDLSDFAEEFPNMLTINVRIQFDGTTQTQI